MLDRNFSVAQERERRKERTKERTRRGRDEERKVERKIFFLPPSPYAHSHVRAGEEEGDGRVGERGEQSRARE